MLRVLSCILLCFVVVSVNGQWSDSSWTDTEFGGILYLCFDGNTVEGAYSEFGLLQGTLSNSDVITGNFYDAGAGEFSCVTGNFELEISNDGDSFSGFYTCEDDDESYDWSETRVGGASSVSSTSCAILDSSSSSIAGSFTNNYGSYSFDVDVCVDDDEYNVSYNFDGVDGYETGRTFESGRVGSGIYQNEDGSYGASIYFILESGDLGNFFWRGDDNGEIDTFGDYNNSVNHGYDIIEANGDASNSDCAENDYLEIDDFDDVIDNDDDDGDDDGNDDDDASYSTILSAVTFVTLFIAFFAF